MFHRATILFLLVGFVPGLTSCDHKSSPSGSSKSTQKKTDDSKNEEATSLPPEVTPTAEVNKDGLASKRHQLDETVWNKEVVAQQYEMALVHLWDALLDQSRLPDGDELLVLQHLPFDTITLGHAGETQKLDHGISISALNANASRILPADWKLLVGKARDEDYRLIQSEWHHATFDIDKDGKARSTISMALYATNAKKQERCVIRGNLVVNWQPRPDKQSVPIASSIDATGLQRLSRTGPGGFSKIHTVDHARPDTRSGVQPVIAHDLNGDGLSEILLVGSNELLTNKGNGSFQRERLCIHREQIFEAGVVAEMTGDGVPDLLVPGARGDLLLYEGQKNRSFTTAPIGKARQGGPLIQPQAMTVGDVDLDGDLDLWIGQYKIAYIGGQMPTPYYDANDGFPAFLLLNDGQGRFSPATEESGLGGKRFRRSYGGSLIDLDTDGDLDLLVVSDFAGVDYYENDGRGYFRDVTDDTFDERHLFGMSVSFADFDLDGQTDIFVTGMASTTARRLEHMKLGRRDRPEIHLMRSRMGYGNRMYLANGNRFTEPSFRDQVARTGWSWGSTAFDFDNDADPDIYVANGHSSGKSTKDHCTHFWCHDIYEGDSNPNEATQELFQDVLSGYFDRSESWDGYQKNALLMNRNGQAFENIAFLLGLGHEFDGRAAISDDIDGDGRVDLLVVEDKWNNGQRLHIYRNELDTENHWIGIHLSDEVAGHSTIGCRVTLFCDDYSTSDVIVAGDSIHAQHAPTSHFGLGERNKVKAIEVTWLDGHQERIENPAIDQYHRINRNDTPSPSNQ
ncbi:MAG: CRTAC1 family protein [Planctomycetaceae bacterium]|nr:CRTAC1 family protein [Planctomycetaceae bacterium]